MFLDRWNLWHRLTRYRSWKGPKGEMLDGTNNACQRAIGLWIKERYRTMRGDIGPRECSQCQSLTGLVWQLPQHRGRGDPARLPAVSSRDSGNLMGVPTHPSHTNYRMVTAGCNCQEWLTFSVFSLHSGLSIDFPATLEPTSLIASSGKNKAHERETDVLEAEIPFIDEGYSLARGADRLGQNGV